MNIDQAQAAFEEWASEKWPGASFSPDQNNCGLVVAERYKHPRLQAAWEAYQAALASPEVQALREDAERLDWIQEQATQSRSGVGFDWRPAHIEEGQVLEMKGWRFMRHHFLGDRKPNIREAIDSAMRTQK